MTAGPLFRDREDAGDKLASTLAERIGRPDLLVIGIPRGGIPVARRVADALRVPLDVFVARKLGVPGIPEVALGAIAERGHRIVEESVSWFIGVPRRIVEQIAAQERIELERRAALYRPYCAFPDARGRTVVLVDDGAATGATLSAAAVSLGQQRPARLIAATPVASSAALDFLRSHVDEVVTLATPEPFHTVSAWYGDSSPVSDADIIQMLGHSDMIEVQLVVPEDAERLVPIPLNGEVIDGELSTSHAVPKGLIILAHGGGSSRGSYRNRYLAGRLRLEGYATLRLDLLTQDEQRADAESAALRFDVMRLAHRLLGATEWAAREQIPGATRIILMGASTAAAAALVAAAVRPELVCAVVARGGRVDLAGEALKQVRSPVLLVVGRADPQTLWWNREAMRVLATRARLIVVPRAGHTFEEPGMLGAVGEHVVRWLAADTASRRRRLPAVMSGLGRSLRF